MYPYCKWRFSSLSRWFSVCECVSVFLKIPMDALSGYRKPYLNVLHPKMSATEKTLTVLTCNLTCLYMYVIYIYTQFVFTNISKKGDWQFHATTGHVHFVLWFVCWWLVWVFIEVRTFGTNAETSTSSHHAFDQHPGVLSFSNPWGWESTKTSQPSLKFDRESGPGGKKWCGNLMGPGAHGPP